MSVLTQAVFTAVFGCFLIGSVLEARADEVQDAHREKSQSYNAYYKDLAQVKTREERAKRRKRIDVAQKKLDESIQKKGESVSREVALPSDYPAAPDKGTDTEVDASEGSAKSSAPAPSAAKTTSGSTPAAAPKKDAVVLDGADVPREVEFSGKQKKGAPRVPDGDNPDYVEFEGKKP